MQLLHEKVLNKVLKIKCFNSSFLIIVTVFGVNKKKIECKGVDLDGTYIKSVSLNGQNLCASGNIS